MSLLGSQVYANENKAIWLPAAGGVITGNLTVAGDVTATDFITQGNGGFRVETSIGVPKMFMGNVANQSFIQSDDPLYFTRLGGIAQTSLSLTTAPALDTFTTGIVDAKELVVNAVGPAAMAGSDSILVGNSGVTINTTLVTPGSIIVVQHTGAAAAGPGNGAAQGSFTVNPALFVPGVSFQVDLVDPATGIITAATVVDVEFSWLLFNT